MDSFLAFTDLTSFQFWLLCGVTLLAGIVRGFSGFAYSAVVMASAAPFIPPVHLIPLCFWMELCASVLLLRGGWQEADRRIVFGLVAGTAIGAPVGFYLTTTLPVETSKFVVLGLVITLAALLLARVRLAFLATRAGLYLSGVTAGVVSGLASIGGLVVAIYVLSQDAPARQIRAALVLFLFLSSATALVYLVYFEIMTATAVKRAMIFAFPTFLGVFIGQALFTPKYEPYYRPFCLTLLIGLAVTGLARTQMS